MCGDLDESKIKLGAVFFGVWKTWKYYTQQRKKGENDKQKVTNDMVIRVMYIMFRKWPEEVKKGEIV